MRRAFTLIEVMAVVLIVGLLAGSVALTLGGQASYRSTEDLVDALQSTDRKARHAAMRLGEDCVLKYDLSRQRVWREIDGRDGVRERSTTLAIPTGYKIDRVVVPGEIGTDGGSNNRIGRRIDRGVVEIALSGGGRSVTYAVRLTRGDEEKRWLIYAGLTGQVTETDDEREIDNLFALLTAGRADAD